MNKLPVFLIALLISALVTSGCTSSKSRVFGKDMPSMKEIHDQKFGDDNSKKPQIRLTQRKINSTEETAEDDFMWLPNPTMYMFVFKHFTAAGNPVPGYTTYFKMYERDTLALPSEMDGWE